MLPGTILNGIRFLYLRKPGAFACTRQKNPGVFVFLSTGRKKKLWDYANGLSINTKCSVSERSHLLGGGGVKGHDIL